MRIPILFLLPALAWAQDPAPTDGQSLHDAQCVACHGAMTQGHPEQMYTREDRKVADYNGLLNQVQRCELQLGLSWFDTEIQAVTEYLDQTYYHFNNPPE